MASALSILLDTVLFLQKNNCLGYFVLQSKQEEFHAHHGYCFQQMLRLHDDEWECFCLNAGIGKFFRGIFGWNDSNTLSSLASELTQKAMVSVQFTTYRIQKQVYGIGGRSKLVICIGSGLPTCSKFFSSIRQSSSRPFLSPEIIIKIPRISLTKTYKSMYMKDSGNFFIKW